jgi:hypothetical protein
MPGLGATDPAKLEAKARSDLGLSRVLQVDRRVDPSVGGSRGYPVWNRIEQLARRDAGEETVASKRSLERWDIRLLPYAMTGNKQKTQVVGIDIVNLVIFLLAWPDATLDEMATHLYNDGAEQIYSRPTMSIRLGELEIAKKKAATDAYQSQSEEVQDRLDYFFNCPPPLGISGTAPIEYKICDLTESVRLEKEEDWDMARLERAIYRAAHLIGPFDSTFYHCGYRWVLDQNGNVTYQA